MVARGQRKVGYNLYINDTTTGKPIPGSPVSVPAGGGGDLSYPLSNPLPVSDSYSFYVRTVFADGSLGPPGQTDDFHALHRLRPRRPASSGKAPWVTPRPRPQPTFQWSAVADAAGYEIEIEDTTANTIGYVLYPTSVTGTSYALGQTADARPHVPVAGGRLRPEIRPDDRLEQPGLVPGLAPLPFPLSPPTPVWPSGTTTSASPTFQWSSGYPVRPAIRSRSRM